MGVNRSTQTGEQDADSESPPEQENEQNESIATAAETAATKSNPLLKTCATVGVAVGAVGAVWLAPVVLAGVGFGAAGVTAGSLAALLQSSIGAVASGSWFAACQSAGAAGLATSTLAKIGVAGGSAGAAAGSAAGSLSYRFRSRFKRLITPTVVRSTQTIEQICKNEESIRGKKKIKFVGIFAFSAVMFFSYYFFAKSIK